MDRRIGKTRDSIKKAYFEILKEKKSGKISVTEIARRANIDRKTFYLHYDTPDSILNDICETVLTETMEHVREKSESAPADITVKNMLELLTESTAENLDTFKVLYCRDEGRSLFEKLKNILILIISSEYNETLGLSDIEFRIYSEFFLSGIISVYSLWITNKLPLSIEEIGEMVTSASMKGLEGIINNKRSEA